MWKGHYTCLSTSCCHAICVYCLLCLFMTLLFLIILLSRLSKFLQKIPLCLPRILGNCNLRQILTAYSYVPGWFHVTVFQSQSKLHVYGVNTLLLFMCKAWTKRLSVLSLTITLLDTTLHCLHFNRKYNPSQ